MQTIKIRLRKPTRVFTFLSDNLTIKRDETCIVKSDRGLEYGTCVLPPEACPVGMEKRYKMKVIRKTTSGDEVTFIQVVEEERKARDLCKKKILDRNLEMKLVDVEYTFDKEKVIFYFTAEDRIDFRQLVRDLAQELKTRIELRHIQVRDEAKLVGGIGVCGRELCCATWLREFKPISMKMAKRQNLSLNPSKISGQCGRLLCCLSYENDLYQQRRKARPDKPDKPDKPVKEVDDETRMKAEEIAEDRALEALEDMGADVEVIEENSSASQEAEQPADAAKPRESAVGEPASDATQPAEGKQADAKPSGRRRRRRRRRGGGRGPKGAGGGNSGSGNSGGAAT